MLAMKTDATAVIRRKPGLYGSIENHMPWWELFNELSRTAFEAPASESAGESLQAIRFPGRSLGDSNQVKIPNSYFFYRACLPPEPRSSSVLVQFFCLANPQVYSHRRTS